MFSKKKIEAKTIKGGLSTKKVYGHNAQYGQKDWELFIFCKELGSVIFFK
jgi:hypothetical protein